MPWFWGSSKNDDDEDYEDDDNDDDEEEYSSSGSYEEEDDDEEEGSFESEENEDSEDATEESTSTNNDENDGGDTPTTTTTIDPKETKKDVDEADQLDEYEEDLVDDDYVMPIKPQEKTSTSRPVVEDKTHTNNKTMTSSSSNGVGNPTKKEEEEDGGGGSSDVVEMNRTDRSIESISIGNEDLSLIDSDHMHSEDYLNMEDSDSSDDENDKEEEHSKDDDESNDDDEFTTDDDDDDDSTDDEEEEEEEEDDDSTDDDEEEEGEEIQTSNIADGVNGEAVKVSTIDNDEDSDDDDDENEEEEEVTSFWEKQNLLILAAEHDRVDILKAILTDEDDDRDLLMREGIPPLHISISFGSTNATQSLLRMGADPSIRPNIAEIKRKQQQQSSSSSNDKNGGGGGGGKGVEIPNMQRFDGISAWELAFGNKKYEESLANSPRSSSWSLFGKSSSTLGDDPSSTTDSSERVIKPVDMAPSKREGIRHAFTAESLRCIGGDEVIRLGQLLDSGMPPTIDIGGKDLYGWAVEMGAMKCEELLRPTEAAKHEDDDGSKNSKTEADEKGATAVDVGSGDESLQPTTTAEDNNKESGGRTSFRILDRQGQQKDGKDSIPSLINRLDELESLASALSTCLDNLAEEVSVCHGLLLMGGGATALAAHVKSLKTIQYQKSQRLVEAQEEWEESEQELAELIMRAGEIGKQVPPNLGTKTQFSRTESFWKKQQKQKGAGDADGNGENNNDDDAERCQLKAQIANSENKIRKLRTSIADLSDENAKEMEEVEKRGLSGGINLVRTLREEIRDTDFQLSETKSQMASCRAQINWIRTKLNSSQVTSSPSEVPAAAADQQQEPPSSRNKTEEVTTSAKPKAASSSSTSENGITDGNDEGTARTVAPTPSTAENTEDSPTEQSRSIIAQKSESKNIEQDLPQTDDTDDDSIEPILQEMLEGKLGKKQNGPTTISERIEPSPAGDDANTSRSVREAGSSPASSSTTTTSRSLQEQKISPENTGGTEKNVPITTSTPSASASERIATGDSQALAIRPATGTRGYLTVDIWQVLLRIMGFNRAAARRGVEVAHTQPKKAANLMIV